MATLHPGQAIDDDDDDDDDDQYRPTFNKNFKTHSILSVFRMARHVRAAPECNTMVQPSVYFCCFRLVMFRPYIVL